jgi:ubiquinone/menaquinone biosynthesis C-methylase UbiE
MQDSTLAYRPGRILRAAKAIARRIPPIDRLVKQRDALLALHAKIADLQAPDASSDAVYSTMSIGPVRHHFDSPIVEPELLIMAQHWKIKRDAETDDLPLPPNDQREHYHANRHFEHWLTGRKDAQHVIAATADLPSNPIILDFGGATGRVIRHMPKLVGTCRCLIAEVNEQYVIWTNTHLAPSVIAFQTRYQPPFPLPDHSVDVAMAFSVFTHIYEYETAWLLELRRVLKPSGLLYVTIHDDATWDTMEQSVFHPLFTSSADYQRLKRDHPKLEGRLRFAEPKRDVLSQKYINVFHSQKYIRSLWSYFFEVEAIHSLRHGHQAGVILRGRAWS